MNAVDRAELRQRIREAGDGPTNIRCGTSQGRVVLGFPDLRFEIGLNAGDAVKMANDVSYEGRVCIPDFGFTLDLSGETAEWLSEQLRQCAEAACRRKPCYRCGKPAVSVRFALQVCEQCATLPEVNDET